MASHIWEAKYWHQFDGFNTYEWAPDPNGYRGCETAYSRWLAIHHPAILDRWKRYGNKIGHIPVEAHFTTWAANRTIDYLQRMQETSQPFFVVWVFLIHIIFILITLGNIDRNLLSKICQTSMLSMNHLVIVPSPTSERLESMIDLI